MNVKSTWAFPFYPKDSRGEKIYNLEALLAQKVANGEPISDTVKALQVLRNHQQIFLTKNEESTWGHSFYPSDSLSSKISNLEALLAQKVANGEPISDTVKVLQILRDRQQGFLVKAFMQWVNRPRHRCYFKQETTIEHKERGHIGSIFVSAITSLIVLTIFFGWYEAEGNRANLGSHSTQDSLLKK